MSPCTGTDATATATDASGEKGGKEHPSCLSFSRNLEDAASVGCPTFFKLNRAAMEDTMKVLVCPPGVDEGEHWRAFYDDPGMSQSFFHSSGFSRPLSLIPSDSFYPVLSGLGSVRCATEEAYRAANRSLCLMRIQDGRTCLSDTYRNDEGWLEYYMFVSCGAGVLPHLSSVYSQKCPDGGCVYRNELVFATDLLFEDPFLSDELDPTLASLSFRVRVPDLLSLVPNRSVFDFLYYFFFPEGDFDDVNPEDTSVSPFQLVLYDRLCVFFQNLSLGGTTELDTHWRVLYLMVFWTRPESVLFRFEDEEFCDLESRVRFVIYVLNRLAGLLAHWLIPLSPSNMEDANEDVKRVCDTLCVSLRMCNCLLMNRISYYSNLSVLKRGNLCDSSLDSDDDDDANDDNGENKKVI